MKEINNLFKSNKAILLGFIIGIWSFFSLGTLFITALTVILIYLFSFNFKEPAQRKNIIFICVLAISLRFLLATIFYYFSFSIGKGADFFGDARAYSVNGQYIAELTTHKSMPDVDGSEPGLLELLWKKHKGDAPLTEYRMDGFPRVIGLFYSIFGYAPVTVKFLNSFISVFTAVLFFLSVKDMFSVKVANIALVLSLFWPSIILWSVTTLKDTMTIFLVTLIFFIFNYLRKYLNSLEAVLVLLILMVPYFPVILLTFICIILIRIYKKAVFKQLTFKGILLPSVLILIMKIAYELLYQVRLHWAMTLLVTFLLSMIIFLNKKKLVVLFVLLLCLGLALLLYLTKFKADINKYYAFFIKKTIIIQRGQLYPAKTGYKIYPDRFYETDSNGHFNSMYNISHLELAVVYFKGLRYTLFYPIPFVIKNNAANLFASMQMVIYYILLPFIICGFFIAFRYRWRYTLPMAIFILSSASLHALSEGNIGSLFRHRDVFMVFFLIFGAIGISNFLGYINKEEIV